MKKDEYKIWKKYIQRLFDRNDNIQSFEAINEIPENILFSFKNKHKKGLELFRLEKRKDDDGIYFKLDLPKETILSRLHDCERKIIVYKGKLKDNITKNILTPGGILVTPSCKEHELEALEDTTIYVKFTK